MIKNRIKIIFVSIVVLICAASLLYRTSANSGSDGFSHSSESHSKIECASCHKNPTPNWVSARGFPDVADYPGHASCVSCHRNEFFRGNHPTICSVCHITSGPRGKARFPFPENSRTQEFETIFPHDIHQNIIAENRDQIDQNRFGTLAVAHFVKAGFQKKADDENRSQFNNCSICHQTASVVPTFSTYKPKVLESLADPEPENFTAKAEFFKDMPDNHASCFNCHYQGQQPVRTDCAGCHRPVAPYVESKSVQRYSLKFNHLSENHANKDCTVCHVRITQTADLRRLINADVPLLTCSTSSCHSDKLVEEIGKREKSIADKEKVFQCNYCHTVSVGRYKTPVGHLEQAK